MEEKIENSPESRSRSVIYNDLTKDQKCIYTFSGHHIADLEIKGTLWNIETKEHIRTFNNSDWYPTLQNNLQYESKASPDGRFFLLCDGVDGILFDLETQDRTDLQAMRGGYFLPCSSFLIFNRYKDNAQKTIVLNIKTKEEIELSSLNNNIICNISLDGLYFLVIQNDELFLKSKSKSIFLAKNIFKKFEFTKDSKYLYMDYSLWNIETVEEIGHYYGIDSKFLDFPVDLCPVNHQINIRGIITAVRIWDFIEHCYQEPSADCPFCGKRFIPDNSILSRLNSIEKEDYNSSIPVSWRIDIINWDHPDLLLNCPHCHKKLKFNPFIY